jgi:uncharacterized SAM-binding protein YcdF (DUF218 family)
MVLSHNERDRPRTTNRKRNLRRIFFGLLVLVVAWQPLAWLAARALVVEAPIPSADAIVVLSGSAAYVERTHKAAQLYRQRRSPVVLLTDDQTRGGWSTALQTNPYFVERARDELIKQGIPAEQIRIVPGRPSSTYSEMAVLRQYATAEGLRSLLVVTSAYHSRRALRTFRRGFAGTGVIIGLEVAPPGIQTPSASFWWMHLEGWQSVGEEYVKLVYYWLRY